MGTKLTRYTAVLFGSSAGTNTMSEFGSLAAGTPARYTGAAINPAIIQSLSNFLLGWTGAVMLNNAIALEDLDSICYLFAYQIAYGFEMGVPEYDASTNYFTGSICSSSGQLYISLTDNNLGNALTNNTYWKTQGGAIRTVTTSDNASASDDLIRVNNGSSACTETLPQISTLTLGKKFTVKRLPASTANVTVAAYSGDLIDGAASVILEVAGDSMTVENVGTGWDII